MIAKPILSIFLFILFIPVSVFSQSGQELEFPDIPGYKTLKCDFHMHTVFSDGLVWPSVRVDEAINDGLDAISITDHLEYHPNSDHVSGDQNIAYELAKPYADKKGLILIHATEMTKSMPPGHFNFLFIQDANGLDTLSWQDAIIHANREGAFVFWNHPGWRQENEIPIWYIEHTWLLEKGLIQGIEIVNENSYYPLAHQWGIDSGLTLIGNSDIHDPVGLFFNRTEGEHRPITLVFAREKSEEGIREALDNGQTAIYYKDMVIGDEWFLKELFYASITIYDIHSQHLDGSSSWETLISNSNSSIPIQLEMISGEGEEPRTITLLPEDGITIDFPNDDLNRKWRVTNFFTKPGECLTIEYIQPN